MTPEEAFLQDIIEHPDDDGLRLIYADYLDERGDPRGEFIRVQCQLAKLTEGDPRREGLEARERELLSENERAWAADLPEFVERCEFRRGFVGGIIAPARKFVKHGDARNRLPLVEHAWFHGVTPRLAPALMESPFLAGLTSLDLSGIGYGDARAQAVAASPLLMDLTALYLVRARLSDAGVEALAVSPVLSCLRVLDLSENRIGDGGLRALAESPRVGQLASLKLSANQRFRLPGVQAVAGCAQLASLTSLDLSHNFIRDEGAAVLATSPNLTSLEVLDLGSCRIGDRGARALAASPYLTRLRRLHLDGNNIGLRGVRALRERFGESVCRFEW
jgi:uncharacterized protein (TIGR02996 family)